MSSGASKPSAAPPAYLDIAVMEDVREHLLSDRAAIVFSTNLSNILWVNPEGAHLLNAQGVRNALEGDEHRSSAVLKQIEITVKQLENADVANATLRITRGADTEFLPVELAHMGLPDGTKAVLLTSDPVTKRTPNLENSARSLVNSLEGYGHATAVLGKDAVIISTSPTFDGLGITSDHLAEICAEVAQDDDRLVKRFLATNGGMNPAGIARLQDDPPLHLLVVAEEAEIQAAPKPEPDEKNAPLNSWYFAPQQSAEIGEPPSKKRARRTIEIVEAIDLGLDEEEAETRLPQKAKSQPEPVAEEPETTPLDTAPETSTEPEPEPDEAQSTDVQPVRFTWVLDKDLRFDSVSSELAGAVGPNMADIEELSWAEVSARFGFENGEVIQKLLEKGDTWSNRTVSWPVEGTDLRVPVDLSALPMSGRDREFDGFNGFGIVRLADAIVGEPLPMSGNLSEDERSVFDEIGVQLSEAEEQAEETVTDKSAEPPKQDAQEPENTVTEAPLEHGENDTEPEPLSFEMTQANKTVPETEPVKDAPAEPETASAQIEPITVPRHEVDTSILARIPIPVLVYRGTELLFANSDFSNLTGYASLDDLALAGGVETLFGSREDRQGGENAAPIFHAQGHRLNVRAHIQKVPWDAKPAMLLTLRRNSGGHNDQPPKITPSDNGNKTRPEQNKSSGTPSPFTVVEGGGNKNAPQSFGGLDADDLRGILDTASDGVLILTPKGEVMAANQSAEALFDRPAATMHGASLADLLAPESRFSAEDYLAGLAQPGLAQLLNDGREMMLRTPSGGLVPVFMTIGPLGKARHRLCAVMRDITPWKRSEEELLRAKAKAENASEHKSDFLARISHEIRTPLNAIIGFSDLMISERFGEIENDRYRGYLRDIHTSGRHVLDLINDLLDISKIEAGKMELSLDSCELNTLVSSTVALMQADANKDRVIIRTSLSAAVPKVVADPRSLKQIILNLVSNAIKYTRAGGQVIVSTVLEERGDVVLRVRDTGIGMSARDLNQAMQPFQQVTTMPPVDRQVVGGTGLGLPLTRALVEANRALFHIESEPEEGTMVEIRFQPERVLKPA